MGFWDNCVTNLPDVNSSPIGSLFVPLVSANYNKSEPFGIIMMVICGLLVIFNNVAFFRIFLFMPRQPFLWAFLMWGNFVYIFQMLIVINHHVNRVTLILGILHNLYELYITYWNYRAIRNQISTPADTKILEDATVCDRITMWTFTMLAFALIVGQLIVIVLFTDLRYGTYAFYLILFSDSFFISSSLVAFVMLAFRGRLLGLDKHKMIGLLISVVGHVGYAINSLFMCSYPIPTAPIALVTNFVSMAGLTWCMWNVMWNSVPSEPVAGEATPDATFFCT